MSRSKCLMSFFFPSKMVKCEEAISTVNTNEKEVRFKARVGKEQPWEYLGKQDFMHRGKPLVLPCILAKHLVPQ